jgi:hypothetical protein
VLVSVHFEHEPGRRAAANLMTKDEARRITVEKAERDRFYEELYQFMRDAPVVGLACVVDRPGYNHRYRERCRPSALVGQNGLIV